MILFVFIYFLIFFLGGICLFWLVKRINKRYIKHDKYDVIELWGSFCLSSFIGVIYAFLESSILGFIALGLFILTVIGGVIYISKRGRLN